MNNHNIKPLAAISMGDPNGIGSEIILKTVQRKDILNICTPVIFGSSKLIRYYQKHFNLPISFYEAKDVQQIKEGKVNLINVIRDDFTIQWGQSTPEAGNYAFQSLKAAAEFVKSSDNAFLVTAPIIRKIFNPKLFNFLAIPNI